MSKGALLFAFNSPKYNYYEMAVATAKRINHFLNLPVTIDLAGFSRGNYSLSAENSDGKCLNQTAIEI